MKLLLNFIGVIFVAGCDSSKNAEQDRVDSEKVSPVILEGDWGYPNRYFSFKDGNVYLFARGKKEDWPAGKFEIISPNRGVLTEKEGKFYFELSPEGDLTIMFDGGLGGVDLPRI